MEVQSSCPLRVGSLLWQPRPSAWELTVVCKATYLLAPGEAVLAPEQEALNEHDDHWDDDPARGLRAPSDLVPTKPRADVTLVGYAYAPGGQPTRSLTARMLVGDMDKAIEVFCDRTFLPDGKLSEGPRFTRMRLTWERAAGGPGTMNPVGVRNDARDAYGRRALPNLQPVGIFVGSPDDFIEPVGFGPIAASWPTRAERSGMPASRGPAGFAQGPLPETMDYGYFNAAPRDQQLDVLRDNERIVLENLHPEHARLVTSLPGVRPAAFVERGRGLASWLHMQADSLWIDTDRGIATLTWRARWPLTRRDEAGRVVVKLEAPGRAGSWGDIPGATGAPLPAADDNDAEFNTVTIVPTDDMIAPASSVVPFTAAPAEAPRQPVKRDPGAGLPFQRAAPPAAPPRPPPLPRPAAPVAPVAPMAPPVPVAPIAPVASIAPVAPPLPAAPVAPLPIAPPVPVAPVAPPVSVAHAVPAAPAVPAYVMPPPPPQVRPSPADSARPDSPWAAGAPTPSPMLDSGGLARGAAGAMAGGLAARPADASSDPSGSPAPAAPGETLAVRPWSARREPVAPAAKEEAVKPVIVRELLQLAWFDPESVPRIRLVPPWKKVLEELARRPVDKALDEPVAGKEPWEVEDRREIFEILARGERIDGAGVQDAMHGAIRDDGKYVPPLALIAGELETPFDEIEALKATVTAASPLVTPADEGLRISIEAADKFLGRPHLASAPAAAEGLATQIREAFMRDKKSLPPDTLDAQVERAMLAGRHYQKRDVLGKTHLRALLRLPEEPQPLVVYLPDALAKRLPMARRFRARIIAEINPSQDPYEKRDEALRALALGTVTTVKRAKDARDARDARDAKDTKDEERS